MMGEADAFKALCAALADRFSQEGRAGAEAAQRALLRAAQMHPDVPDRAPEQRIAAERIAAAAAHPQALPEAALAARCATLLGWAHWGTGTLDDATAAGIRTAELVGPDGAVRVDDVRVGLLHCDAAVDYPRSAHAGEETYLVLSGTALWSVGEDAPVAHPPGALVHHPSWVPHARRTLDEPFLGAWRWSGELDLSTFALAPE